MAETRNASIENKIRQKCIRMLFFCVLAAFIVDVLFYVYYLYIDLFETNPVEYFFHRLVAPIAVNTISFILMVRVQNKVSEGEKKTFWVCFFCSTIGGSIGFFHSYYIVTWLACAFGILLSSMMHNNGYRIRLVLYCYLLVTLDGLSIIFERAGRMVYQQTSTEYYIQHIFICYILLFFFYRLSKVIHDYIDDMFEAIRTAQETSELYSTRVKYDALTGVYSRDYIYRNYMDIFKDASPKNKKMMAMIDIDDFKLINDTYGHDKGDYVLRRVGDLGRSFGLAEQSDEIFQIARFGGEEFILVFNDSDPSICYMLLELFLREFEATEFDSIDKTVTLSAGLVCVSSPQDFDNIFKIVDKALYDSKKNGKNMITVANI